MSEVEWIRIIAVIGALLVMISGLLLVSQRLKAKEQVFGPNSLKALGLVLFIPILLIIGIVVPNFQTETLAALLGAVAAGALR